MQEREMTKKEKAKEKRLKDKYDDSDMKKSMKKQYGDDWKNVYYATIRKKAMEKHVKEYGYKKPLTSIKGAKTKIGEALKYEYMVLDQDGRVMGMATNYRDAEQNARGDNLLGITGRVVKLRRPMSQGRGDRLMGQLPADNLGEGHYKMPDIDRSRYTEMPGLEGPFQTKAGKVVYYDPKEGAYYDRDTDMYMTYDEFKALDEGKNKMGPQGIKPGDRVEHEGDMYQVVAVDGDVLTVDNLQNGNRTQFQMDDVTRLFGMDAMTDQDKKDAEAMFKRLKKAGSGSLKHTATEAMTDKEVNDFHNELDKVVHKHIGHSSDEDEEKERLTKKIDEMPIPKSTMYGLVIDGKYVAKGSKRDMLAMKKKKGGTVYNAPGKKVGDSEGKVKESGIMYRAGVKKYGKEGMTKIQSAAGSGASAEEIGAIKDKYNKKKTEGASPHPKGSTKYKKHMAAKHAAMGEKLTISNMRKALDLAEDTDSNTVIAGYVRTMLNEKHNTWNKVTKEIDFVINLLEDTKADRLQVFKLLYKKNIQENEDNKIGLKESIDKLRKIVADKSAMPIRFSDGTMKVDMTTANIFLKAYDRMKESNQIKIQDMMKTKAGFLRVLDFIYGAMK